MNEGIKLGRNIQAEAKEREMKRRGGGKRIERSQKHGNEEEASDCCQLCHICWNSVSMMKCENSWHKSELEVTKTNPNWQVTAHKFFSLSLSLFLYLARLYLSWPMNGSHIWALSICACIHSEIHEKKAQQQHSLCFDDCCFECSTLSVLTAYKDSNCLFWYMSLLYGNSIQRHKCGEK